MRDRLIELLKELKKYTYEEIMLNGNCEQRLYAVEHIDELEADYLLDNGVIVPPCKVGTKVYFVHEICDENGDEVLYIDTGEIRSFSLQDTGLWMYCRYKTGLTYWHKVDSEFGTEVFLTREEAEKALKRKEDEGK